MPLIRLSIIYLNYNRLSETELTSHHLQQVCAKRPDIEIIAVDNGSTDGTREYLQQQIGIHALLLTENRGIAGYRAAFQVATGTYILVLDDDSCPEQLDMIDQAIARMQADPNIGITACHIASPNGTQQWSWHLPKTAQLAPSPFFIGCGFIIRRELFQQINWYPDDFFLYQNEIDVSFKTRLAGYNIIYDPNCVIIHRGTPNQRPGWRRVFYPTRNTLWLIRQYYPQPLASYMLISRLLIGLLRALNFRELKTYAHAARAGLCHPISKTPLPKTLRDDFAPFWKQNSIIHQLLKRT